MFVPVHCILRPIHTDEPTSTESEAYSARIQDGGDFRLNVVNATFGQIGFEFLSDFLDRLAVNYGAGLGLRYDFNRKVYIKGGVSKNILDINSTNTPDFIMYQFIFGLMF